MQGDAQRSVLILGARAPVALDHARRFAAQGWRVLVGDSTSCRISSWSKAVHGTIRLPSPRTSLTDYAQVVDGAIAMHGIQLVLPTCEEAFYLSHVRPLLPAQVKVCVSPPALMRKLHSKWQFLDVAREAGVAVPDSALVSNLQEARDWANDRAVVLKPEYSRFGVHVRTWPGGMSAARASDMTGDGPWVVQELCEGVEACSYSIADRGRLLAHVAYRPSYRMARSSSYYFSPCDPPGIRTMVERLVEHTGYSGQISFDWIEDASGNCRALECNPRAISGLHLFSMQDDLPGALMGTIDHCITPSIQTPRMIAAVMASAGLASMRWQHEWRNWRKDWSAASDVIATDGDRGPLLGGLTDIASYAWTALKSGRSLRAASTEDTEWNGEALSLPDHWPSSCA